MKAKRLKAKTKDQSSLKVTWYLAPKYVALLKGEQQLASDLSLLIVGGTL